MKKMKKIIIVTALVVFALITGIFGYNKIQSKDAKQKGMFAIYIDEGDGNGPVASTSNVWPTDGYELDLETSFCDNGSTLTYDSTNKTVGVEAVTGDKCKLYLTTITGEQLRTSGKANLNTTMTGGIYRFYGNSTDGMPENYICFGTTSQSTCTGNTDAYMYRIIGIASDGKMKLIKKEALDTAYGWNNSANITWSNSDLYSGVNGSYFLSNTTYIPDSTWSSRIATTSWKYGDTTSEGSYSGDTIYSTENGWSNTTSAKIGLMYIHDYYYAYNSAGTPGSYSNAKNAWIHLSKNDAGAPNTSREWLLSRQGSSSSSIYAWYVYEDGKVTASSNGSFSVRPVFYLTANQAIAGGSGSLANPYYLAG